MAKEEKQVQENKTEFENKTVFSKFTPDGYSVSRNVGQVKPVEGDPFKYDTIKVKNLKTGAIMKVTPELLALIQEAVQQKVE